MKKGKKLGLTLLLPLLMSNAPMPSPHPLDFEIDHVTNEHITFALNSTGDELTCVFKNSMYDIIDSLFLEYSNTNIRLIEIYSGKTLIPKNCTYTFTLKNTENVNYNFEQIQNYDNLKICGSYYANDVIYAELDLSYRFVINTDLETGKTFTTCYTDIHVDKVTTFISDALFYIVEDNVTPNNTYASFIRVHKDKAINYKDFQITFPRVLSNDTKINCILLKGNDYYNRKHETFDKVEKIAIIYFSILIITVIGTIVYLSIFYYRKHKNKQKLK